MTRVSRRVEIIQEGSLYVLLFLLPFSKAAVEITFAVLLLGWILARLDSRTAGDSVWVRSHLRPLAIAVGLYLAVCALSIAVSHYPLQSLRGFVGKWLEYLLLFMMVADVGSRPGVAGRVALVIAVSSFFVVVEGVTQEVFSRGVFRHYDIGPLYTFDRMTGPYENPIDLATYLMAVIPVLLGWQLTQQRWLRRSLWVLLFVLMVCMARTEAIGVVISFCLAVLVMMRWPTPLRRYGPILLAGFLLAGGFFLQRVGRLGLIFSPTKVGTVDRRFMWQAAINMIKDRPILGHGVNTFMANYLAYWVGGEQQPRYAHNCYLQVAAETGLIGLAAFLWLFWCLLARMLAALHRPFSGEGFLLLGLYGGVLAFVMHAGIDTDFYAMRQAALFWTLAGLGVGLSVRLLEGEQAAAHRRS